MNYYKHINLGKDRSDYTNCIQLVLSKMLKEKLYYTYEIKGKPIEYRKNSLIKSDILVLKDILTKNSLLSIEKRFEENFIENLESYEDNDDDDESDYNKFDIENVYIKIIARSDKGIKDWDGLINISDIIEKEKKRIKKWSNMGKSKQKILENIKEEIWLIDENNQLVKGSEVDNGENIEHYIKK